MNQHLAPPLQCRVGPVAVNNKVELHMQSENTTWTLTKNVQDFIDLHQTQSSQLAVHLRSQHGRLPILPSIEVYFNTNEYIREIEKYINLLLQLPSIYVIDAVNSFFEIPDPVRITLTTSREQNLADIYENLLVPTAKQNTVSNELLSLNIQNNTIRNKKTKIYNSNNNNTTNNQQRPLIERTVMELLSVLKSQPNKASALQRFEEWFFATRPKLSPTLIRILFEGNITNTIDSRVGLLQICGDLNTSRIAAHISLRLVCRLLDIERNRDATIYIQQFCLLHLTVLQKMKLHVHVLSEFGSRQHAFKIVAVLLSSYDTNQFNLQFNTCLGSSLSLSIVQKQNLLLEIVMKDTWARQEFYRWYFYKQDNVLNVSLYDTYRPVIPRVTFLADGQHSIIARQAFSILLNVVDDLTGWRRVIIKNSLNPQAQEITSFLETPLIKTLSTDHLKMEEFLENNLTQVCFKRDIERDITIIRTTTLYHCTPQELVHILYDAEMLPLWDIKVHSCSIITKFNSTTDLIHIVYKSFSSVYKFHDLCLLRSIISLSDNGYCIVLYSVNHPNCPEKKDYTRCYFNPSGYIITPIPNRNNFCLLTNIIQTDKESVLIFTLELLNESQELLHSFTNLHSVIASLQILQNPQYIQFLI